MPEAPKSRWTGTRTTDGHTHWHFTDFARYSLLNASQSEVVRSQKEAFCQSFDVTDLPNGTYYVQVLANPEKRLFESSTTNNESLRKVILGGTPHNRTVEVPPVGVIDAP